MSPDRINCIAAMDDKLNLEWKGLAEMAGAQRKTLRGERLKSMLPATTPALIYRADTDRTYHESPYQAGQIAIISVRESTRPPHAKQSADCHSTKTICLDDCWL